MYLIIGGNGFLGSYLIKSILEDTDEKIIATARDLSRIASWGERVVWHRLEITDFANVDSVADKLRENIESLKVLYLAALHNPDQVEKNPQHAWHVNITSLSYFMNRMGRFNCLIYPSTDSVYGAGSLNSLFSEDDPLHPVNTYGKQKVMAESLVNYFGYKVLRYPFLIAPSLVPHKKHFYDIICDTISAGNIMPMFADSYRSSLDFNTVAKLTISLVEIMGGTLPAVVNIAGDKALSKYDVGLMIAKKLGISLSKIQAVSVNEDHGNIFQSSRAAVTLMDNSLLKKLLNLKAINIEI